METTSSNNRLAWIAALLCCLIVLATLCLSRPSRNEQLEAVNQAGRAYVSARIDSLGLDSVPVMGNIMSEGAKWIGNEAMQSYLDSNFTFHDYYLWTTGTLTLRNGQQRRVAVGLLGHTWVSDKAEIGTAMVEAMQETCSLDPEAGALCAPVIGPLHGLELFSAVPARVCFLVVLCKNYNEMWEYSNILLSLRCLITLFEHYPCLITLFEHYPLTTMQQIGNAFCSRE